jgi:hypothetical protein
LCLGMVYTFRLVVQWYDGNVNRIRREQMLGGKMLKVVVVVVAALGLAASASADPLPTIERVQTDCAAEYGNPNISGFSGVLFYQDTPSNIPIQPQTGPYFAYGSGVTIFRPDGRFSVICYGFANNSNMTPPTAVRGKCFAVRHGDAYGHNSDGYNGEGNLIVRNTGNITITCRGTFTGVLP